MDDPLLVRGLQRVGDLLRDGIASSSGIGPRAMRSARVLAVDELHDERRTPSGLFEAVDVGDVGMIQRGEDLRFALKARKPVGVVRERGRAGS